jgi:uncharacterized protein with HEPN domain
MQHEIDKYLIDIPSSADMLITRTSAITSFEEFETLDDLLKDGILRRLAIIGEAVFQINKIDDQFILTDKKKIAGLRHIIVHDYDKVDNILIYAVLKKHLPALRNEVSEKLNSRKD